LTAGHFRGALVARQDSFGGLYADTVGEVESEKKLERVIQVYADSCPVARSVKGSIEITSELDLTTR
jgi:uncharacterized OsmC-like protein